MARMGRGRIAMVRVGTGWMGMGWMGMVLGVALLAPSALRAQPSARADAPPRRATAMAGRAAERIDIDGVAAEPSWSTAPAISGFRQFDPVPDAEPSQRTEFRVLYDEENLYLFVRAFDSSPDSIMRALSRRDVRGPSDQIGVFIDSYNDRRTGFAFYVNPDGVKRDFSVYDDNFHDNSWNGVWDVATTVDSLGWTAEFRVPLSQLRYADSRSHTFGFGVRRELERVNERSSWPLFSRTVSGFMSQLGELDGLAGLDASRRVELTPYGVTKSITRARAAGGWETAPQASAGGDLKIGLTPNMTLDATVNPDFGQVEADPAVLNLTAFETFVSERRPFFVEGTGLYSFSLNCYIVVDCSTNEGLFYSRRIGRNPALRRSGDVTTPEATPIASAAKLTGRSSGGFSYGVLDAVTRRVAGAGGYTAEPLTNYAVLRAQQDLKNGDAVVSWIATAVNRDLDAATAPFLHQSAYVTGASFRSRFGGRKYEVIGSLAASRVAGDQAVLERTQRSSAHYFQQPGDDPEVDPARTSLSGYAAQIKVGKYAGGVTRFETSLVRQSPGFEVNDLGYLQRADILDWSTWASLNFQTPTRLYRWLSFNGNHWQHWNTSGVALENAWNFNGHIGLNNNWNFHAGGTVGGLGTTFNDRSTRGGPALRQSRRIAPWFGANGDSRRMVVPGMWVNLSRRDEGRTATYSLSPNLSIQASTRFRVSLGTGYSRAKNNTQWYGNFTDDAGTTRHAFARLNQRTVSMNVRVNYTATPDLTFEFYGEPFTSSGTYTDFRQVSATPDAADYADRFVPFTPPGTPTNTFSYRQLRTNAVLRWEYRPGSTLFLVWAHGRQSSTVNEPRQAWNDDFEDLFGMHPDNTFLVKVSYWLNR
ncbi:MAG: DUF5916 domain-containing protein [Longimicrobiales bacterium]